MESFKFKDWKIEIDRKAFYRGINVKVYPNQKIKLTSWVTCRQRDLRLFLEQAEPWIEKQLAEFESLKQRYPKAEFSHGARLPLLGEYLSLRIFFDAERKESLSLKKNELFCIFKNPLEEAQIKEKILKFYRQQAEEIILHRTYSYAKQMQVLPAKIRFRSMKSRWGSCSSKGHICFNWRLIAAPLNVIDYVIVHELSHLVYMNHSSEFWTLVERYCPNYKAQKKWLRENGFHFDFLMNQSEIHGP